MPSLQTSMPTPGGNAQLSAQQQVDENLLSAHGYGASSAAPEAPVGGYETGSEEAAAALVELSGASTITVDSYEASVPPNLAAAASLLDELTSDTSLSFAARAGVYQLLDPAAALTLTAE